MTPLTPLTGGGFVSTQLFAVWGAVLLSLVLCATQIRPGGGLTERFLADDPAVEALQRERQRLGPGDPVYLLVEGGPDWGQVPPQAMLQDWARELESLEGVERVVTPYDLPTLEWTGSEEVRWVPLGETEHPTHELLRNRLYRKQFLALDGSQFLLLVETGAPLEDSVATAAVLARINAWIASKPQPGRFRMAGASAFQQDILRVAVTETPRIVAVVAGMLFLVLGVVLRSVVLALWCVSAALLATGATAGAGWVLGFPFHHSTFLVFPIVLAIALLDNIHILYSADAARTGTPPARERHRRVVSQVGAPCFWTSVTTAGGFLCLLGSQVSNVRYFGLLAALGTAVALATSFLFFLPSLDWFGRWRPPRRLPQWTVPFTGPHRRVALTLMVVLGAACVPGLLQLRAGSDFPMILWPDHPVSRELVELERRWGGVASVSILLRPRPPGSWDDPEVQERFLSFVQLLESRPGVAAVSSVLDLVQLARDSRTRRGDGPLPRSELLRLGRQTMAAGAPPELGRWFASPDGWLRSMVRIPMSDPDLAHELVLDLQGFRRDLKDLFEIELTGWPVLFANQESTLIKEWVRGFALAVAVVSLLLLAALRSVRWWLLALPVNLVPLSAVSAALGYLQIPVGLDFLVIPGMALGIVVDDTIHFLWRVREELARGSPREAAVSTALGGAGSPLALTSLVLVVTFCALHLSSFTQGALVANTMAAVLALALATDFYLVPALIGERRAGEVS